MSYSQVFMSYFRHTFHLVLLSLIMLTLIKPSKGLQCENCGEVQINYRAMTSLSASSGCVSLDKFFSKENLLKEVLKNVRGRFEQKSPVVCATYTIELSEATTAILRFGMSKNSTFEEDKNLTLKQLKWEETQNDLLNMTCVKAWNVKWPFENRNHLKVPKKREIPLSNLTIQTFKSCVCSLDFCNRDQRDDGKVFGEVIVQSSGSNQICQKSIDKRVILILSFSILTFLYH